MFRQLEKSDDAAVGSLLKEGAQISFSNLLTAMRSTRKQGMDYKVDDGFDGVDAVAKNKSITDQILSGFPNLGQESAESGNRESGQRQQDSEQAESYYHMLAGQIADGLEPEMLAETNLTAETTMEEFADALRQQTADDSLEQAYMQEQIQSYRGLENVEETVVRELVAYKQPVTPNNLEAASALRRKPGALYRKLRDLEEGTGVSEGMRKADTLIESLTGKESAQEAYGEMQAAFSSVLDEAMETPEDFLDLRTLQSCQKQLALAGSLSREENYQIPVEINGELTAINLKVLHGTGTGKVNVTVRTEEFGQITAKFSLREQKVSGYIACESGEGTVWLQGRQEELETALEASGEERETGSLVILQGREVGSEEYTEEEVNGGEGQQTADLYKIAKAFITTLTA